MKEIAYQVQYKRTDKHPLVQIGWLDLNRKTMKWHWTPHWTYQAEELRKERDFNTRKEIVNFIRRIGYNDVNLYRLKTR